jgi:hypothetical protein
MPVAAILAGGNAPERRLRAVAGPVGGASDRVPARLVLPVIVPAGEREAVLAPDDLGTDLEAAGLERFLHNAGEAAGMPDIGDLAGKERPGLAPVGGVVVRHPAHLAGAGVHPGTSPPVRLVVDPVGRVGDHQVGRDSGQQLGDCI